MANCDIGRYKYRPLEFFFRKKVHKPEKRFLFCCQNAHAAPCDRTKNPTLEWACSNNGIDNASNSNGNFCWKSYKRCKIPCWCWAFDESNMWSVHRCVFFLSLSFFFISFRHCQQICNWCIFLLCDMIIKSRPVSSCSIFWCACLVRGFIEMVYTERIFYNSTRNATQCNAMQ